MTATYSLQATIRSSLDQTLSLSPAIAYYICKLLRQQLSQLRSVVAPGAGLTADWGSDLNAVIESLYLESDAINTAVDELERLALTHQALSTQAALYPQELKTQESKIFWLLGFKYRNEK